MAASPELTTAAASLPKWVRIGSKCRWWSESQRTFHPIVVTSVDPVKQRVVVHFENDHRVWKTVAFSHIGTGGPLRPLADGKVATTTIPAEWGRSMLKSMGKDPGPAPKHRDELKVRDRADGTATPPWYEHLMVAEEREEVKDEQRRKEEEAVAEEERRKQAWKEEMQKQVDLDKRTREEERRRREEAAELERLRILEKLQFEREEEQRRQAEVHLMEQEEEVTSKVNAVWRQHDEVVRRQQEEEEREQLEEEQRRLQERLAEELASRPRVSFGVKTKMEPPKILIPQPERRVEHSQPSVMPPPDPPKRAAPPLANEALPPAPPRPTASKRWDQQPFPPAPPAGEERAGLPPAEHLEQQQQQFYASAVPQESEPVPEWLTATEYYGAKIRAVYELHNPTKLTDVPGLLEKYAGCEAEMYDRICEKYGVEPEPTPPHLVVEPAPQSVPKPGVGFARKASAPGPPQQQGADRGSASATASAPLVGGKRPPSASALMARFQSLVAEGEEEDVEIAAPDDQEEAADLRGSPAVPSTAWSQGQGSGYQQSAQGEGGWWGSYDGRGDAGWHSQHGSYGHEGWQQQQQRERSRSHRGGRHDGRGFPGEAAGAGAAAAAASSAPPPPPPPLGARPSGGGSQQHREGHAAASSRHRSYPADAGYRADGDYDDPYRRSNGGYSHDGGGGSSRGGTYERRSGSHHGSSGRKGKDYYHDSAGEGGHRNAYGEAQHEQSSYPEYYRSSHRGGSQGRGGHQRHHHGADHGGSHSRGSRGYPSTDRANGGYTSYDASGGGRQYGRRW